MRRILLWGLVALLAFGGFYVAWPAWTARQIRQAIEANDPAALERKVDFPSVRERAKTVLAAEMDRSLERLKQRSGPIGAAVAGQLKDRLGSRVTDAVVDSIFTPGNVVAMVRQGKSLRRVLRERTGDRTSGGTGTGEGPSAPDGGSGDRPTQGEAAQPRRFTLANIKSYRITGPLALAVGIARDPAATEPDVTAEFAFTRGEWKVVGIVPRF